MDRTGITVVSLCAVLLGLWYFKSQKYNTYVAQQQAASYTNTVAAAQAPMAAAAVVTPSAPGFAFSTNGPETTLSLTNAFTNSWARYTFTSRGGGIKSVELLKYAETISARWKKSNTPTNAVITLNDGAAVPVMAILGDPAFVGDGDFTLTPIANGVEAEKSLPNGLVLTKDFRLGSNYLVAVTVTLKNDSGKPLPLAAQNWVIGTATPMGIDDINFFTYGGSMWFDGSSSYPINGGYFNPSTTYLFVIPRVPKTQYDAGAGNVLWAAAYNQYFTVLAMPPSNQLAQSVSSLPVTLPGTNTQFGAGRAGIQTALVYPAMTLAPDQVLQRQITLYAGPKEFRTLEKIGEKFQNQADLAMNFGTGFSSFWGVGSFFAKILLLLMNWLHDLLPSVSYGWIIVLITISLRAAFWPITAASMRSMKRMQALAPQVKALKEKYGDDPQKFTQMQMKLWKDNKVSPMSGCLPALLQTPVFLGFFTMIRSAIELRGAHFLWISDLTKPDTLFIVPGFDFPFNLLPLVMVGVMVWQAHLQPVSPGMDPSQQKMMRYMPLIFLVIFYNYSAGMALYLTVSTSAGILQQRLIKNTPLPPVTPPPSPLAPAPKKKK